MYISLLFLLLLVTEKLSGMQEHTLTVACSDYANAAQRVLNSFNVNALSQHVDGVYRFSGEQLVDDSALLITLVLKRKTADQTSGDVSVTVNCEDFMFAGHVTDLIKKSLA